MVLILWLIIVLRVDGPLWLGMSLVSSGKVQVSHSITVLVCLAGKGWAKSYWFTGLSIFLPSPMAMTCRVSERARSCIRVVYMSFLQRMFGSGAWPWGGAQISATASPHPKEPAVLAGACGYNASVTALRWGVPNWVCPRISRWRDLCWNCCLMTLTWINGRKWMTGHV